MNHIPRALTIAGSDSGGGAGIQADIKTFQELEVYGMSAITAITAQNTLGVTGIQEIDPDIVAKQIDAVVSDIGVDAAKTGMIANIEIMQIIAEKVKQYQILNLVVDPVMVSKSGHSLLEEEARLALKELLIPLAMVVTPNLPEAEVLIGKPLDRLEARKEAAQMFIDWGAKHVVIKGGHDKNKEKAEDLFYDGKEFVTLSAERFETKHTHGTGCTFSAAITAYLAKGVSPLEAVHQAKTFISQAISHPLQIGKGHGPTNHWAHRMRRE
ncbi:bifunctional hydroxymethylpyrimidine kinase/phosphomethylpyrimidine kinase [Thermoflavimicrobium dichotomicum]